MAKTRQDHAAEARARYEYELRETLTLAQAAALRNALAGVPELEGLRDRLKAGIDWAWRYCDDVALKESIADGYR